MAKIAIIFAFGAPKNLPVNQVIAKSAESDSSKIDYVFTQEDIPLDSSDKVIILEGGRYLSTLALLQGVRQFCVKGHVSIEKIFVLAVRPHLWRVFHDAKKVFGHAVIPLRLRTEISPYHKDSSQWWTRGPIRWWARELPLRLLRLVSWKRYKKLSLH